MRRRLADEVPPIFRGRFLLLGEVSADAQEFVNLRSELGPCPALAEAGA